MAVRVVLAALASAVLLWASAPPVGAGPLAWVALVPVALVVLARPGDRWARAAVPLAYGVYLELLLVPALPFGLTEGQFAHPPVPILIGDTPLLPVAFLAIPLFTAILYAIRFGLPAGRALPRRSAPAAVAAVVWPAVAWTGLEMLRVKFDPGGLWGPLFASQQGVEGALAFAPVVGPWGISFAIVATNYLVAAALVRRSGAVAGLAVATVALVAGALLFASGGSGTSQSIRVAAVQPGYDTAERDLPQLRRWVPGSYDLAALDVIEDLAPLTLGAAEQGAELIVWPEASIWTDPRSNLRVRRKLSRLARQAGAAIVVPYFLRDVRQSAAVVLTSKGHFSAPMPKQRPMWFLGEDFGNEAPATPVDAGPIVVGTLLGVDNQDPGLARRLAAEGAGVIASSTHDWKQLAVHQSALAAFGASAAKRPIVRSDWRYRSAIFESDGSRLASAGAQKRRAVVVADVRLGAGSPYPAVADWLSWLVVAALLIGAVVPPATRGLRRARRFSVTLG